MALQPIPDYSIEDPTKSFVSTLGMVQAVRQQQAQQQRAQALQAAIQSAADDPSPENLSKIYLQFPEAKEQLDAYRSALSDADKGTLGGAAREAIIASQTGRVDQIAGIFERYAVAAENSGRADLAQQFRDAKRTAEIDPDAAALTARSFYHGIDPDGYKSVFQAQGEYDTPFLKEMIAEGLRPGTPEWTAALQNKREGDPWIVVPGIGLYRKEDVVGLTQGQSAAPSIPDAAAKYLRENPNLRDAFDKKYGAGAADRILGGGASNGTGGF